MVWLKIECTFSEKPWFVRVGIVNVPCGTVLICMDIDITPVLKSNRDEFTCEAVLCLVVM